MARKDHKTLNYDDWRRTGGAELAACKETRHAPPSSPSSSGLSTVLETATETSKEANLALAPQQMHSTAQESMAKFKSLTSEFAHGTLTSRSDDMAGAYGRLSRRNKPQRHNLPSKALLVNDISIDDIADATIREKVRRMQDVFGSTRPIRKLMHAAHMRKTIEDAMEYVIEQEEREEREQNEQAWHELEVEKSPKKRKRMTMKTQRLIKLKYPTPTSVDSDDDGVGDGDGESDRSGSREVDRRQPSIFHDATSY